MEFNLNYWLNMTYQWTQDISILYAYSISTIFMNLHYTVKYSADEAYLSLVFYSINYLAFTF